MRLPDPPLLVITDRHQARRPLEEVAEAAFAGGCRWLSLREKDLDAAEPGSAAAAPGGDRRSAYGATVMVHEDIAAAMAAGAGGVHLPRGVVADCGAPSSRRGGADRLLDPRRARSIAAMRSGADYATLSPIFPSASKPGYGPAIGLAGLASAVAAARVAGDRAGRHRRRPTWRLRATPALPASPSWAR